MSGLGVDVLVGKVIVIHENDYRYGLGTLRLRPERISGVRSEPGWALVTGVVVDFRGIEHAPREVLVRVGALQACVADL
ncbi:MAG TPA: hypothetical protein VGJ28_01680 [Micromonosporaceae bacterium]|jgi:hypothetical protein